MLPDYMLDAIDRYVNDRIQPGHFLLAVLSNDLREAVARADHININLLPEYVRYVYNNIPHSCWGSPDRVRAWLNGGVSADV